MTKAATYKPLVRTCTANVSNQSLFVADHAGQPLFAELRDRHHHPSQTHSIRQFTMPLRSAGKPPPPEIVCTRKAWMITDVTTIFKANADLVIAKNHVDNSNNNMHTGPAGLRQVNNTHKVTTKRLSVSGPITTSNNAPSSILDTSRLPLAVFIFAAVALLT